MLHVGSLGLPVVWASLGAAVVRGAGANTLVLLRGDDSVAGPLVPIPTAPAAVA